MYQQSQMARQFHPPQDRGLVQFSHKFRYASTGVTNLAVGTTQLINALAVGKVVNTSVSSIFYAVKIKSIEIWAPPASQGSSAFTSILWIGGASGTDINVNDMSMSTAEPAHVLTRPPKGSSASFWTNADNLITSLFQITAPSGSVVDIVMDCIVASDQFQTTTSVTTATVGAIYGLYLDWPTSHALQPIGIYPTF